MMMPSIALPTGPYDWHPERNPRAVYEARVEHVRAAMARRGLTHVIVHGNILDHGALRWLTHFTPKLGPAYALVPAAGPLRILFSGGPGMKPSAQKLTWVEDLAALRSIEGDAKRWLEETAGDKPVRPGLVEGEAMLRSDWLAVQRVAGGKADELDDALAPARASKSETEVAAENAAAEMLDFACAEIARRASPGADLRAAVIAMERAVYAAGAQDVRVLASRRPNDAEVTTLRDAPQPITGPTAVAISVRHHGAWAHRRFTLSPIA